MKKLLQVVWPRPERIQPESIAEHLENDTALDASILDLQGPSTEDASLYLDAARRIKDEEDKRKAGADARATSFIAAVAALIPLMTWAISNTGPSVTCTPGWGCLAWTATFALAVLYFITAAYWALKTLEVATYHVIGVEDIVQIKKQRKNLPKALIQQTLLLGRRNRNTINEKLTCIKVAQQRFFNGLAVLGFLLMIDPVSRFGIIDTARNQITTVTSGSKSVACEIPGVKATGQQESEGYMPILRVTRQLCIN